MGVYLQEKPGEKKKGQKKDLPAPLIGSPPADSLDLSRTKITLSKPKKNTAPADTAYGGAAPIFAPAKSAPSIPQVADVPENTHNGKPAWGSAKSSYSSKEAAQSPQRLEIREELDAQTVLALVQTMVEHAQGNDSLVKALASLYPDIDKAGLSPQFLGEAEKFINGHTTQEEFFKNIESIVMTPGGLSSDRQKEALTLLHLVQNERSELFESIRQLVQKDSKLDPMAMIGHAFKLLSGAPITGVLNSAMYRVADGLSKEFDDLSLRCAGATGTQFQATYDYSENRIGGAHIGKLLWYQNMRYGDLGVLFTNQPLPEIPVNKSTSLVPKLNWYGGARLTLGPTIGNFSARAGIEALFGNLDWIGLKTPGQKNLSLIMVPPNYATGDLKKPFYAVSVPISIRYFPGAEKSPKGGFSIAPYQIEAGVQITPYFKDNAILYTGKGGKVLELNEENLPLIKNSEINWSGVGAGIAAKLLVAAGQMDSGASALLLRTSASLSNNGYSVTVEGQTGKVFGDHVQFFSKVDANLYPDFNAVNCSLQAGIHEQLGPVRFTSSATYQDGMFGAHFGATMFFGK